MMKEMDVIVEEGDGWKRKRKNVIMFWSQLTHEYLKTPELNDDSQSTNSSFLVFFYSKHMT